METVKIDKLYEDYGKLMIQLEIVQNQVNEIKRQIVNEINKNQVNEKEPKKE